MAFYHTERRYFLITNSKHQRRPDSFGLEGKNKYQEQNERQALKEEEIIHTFKTSVGKVYCISRYWSSSSGGMSRIGSDGWNSNGISDFLSERAKRDPYFFIDCNYVLQSYPQHHNKFVTASSGFLTLYSSLFNPSISRILNSRNSMP